MHVQVRREAEYNLTLVSEAADEPAGAGANADATAANADADATVKSSPPPPPDWHWPKEGDIIEVEVQEASGATCWRKARVSAVLVDGLFQVRPDG